MPLNILIVEDNQDTRDTMRIYFTFSDFKVMTAADGSEGFNKAKAGHPDLIITDLAMPNLSGVEMIKRLHSDSTTAGIPILIFTAKGSGIAGDGLRAGALKAFYKPLDFDALVNEVKAQLESREITRQ
jgi:DNA-binding response OmpR family regulator